MVSFPSHLGILIWAVLFHPALLVVAPVSAREPDASRFATQVSPVFRKHCFKCHDQETRKGGLSLASLAALARGGESGDPVVVAGDTAKSRLLELVKSGEMPPGDDRLSDGEIQVIERWIRDSARRELASLGDATLSPKLLAARRVHFLLEVKCQQCHGRDKREGGLDLRNRASILKGGKSGPALIPGDSAKSLLLRRIHADEMPPRDVRYKLSIRPVSEVEQQMVRDWIDAGAVTPPTHPMIDDEGRLVSSEDRRWWSFQPPRAAPIPTVRARQRVRTAIDAFLLNKLEARGLSFSDEADRRTLIRRLSMDLLGITPSLEETREFLADSSPMAFERLVDRLLASPRYGERWGRHWLDAAGYADSEGSASADTIYPLVYQYRDYVIRAINADKPYDRFVLEQLAGDELADYRTIARMTPSLKDNLIATGYLRTCIDPTTSPETNFLEDRYQVLADTVEIVSSSLLGLTVRCARCHSHKYDPLPQRDYYRFTAIFAAAYAPHDWVKPRQRTIELSGVEDRRRMAEFNASINDRIHPINLQVADWTKQYQQRYQRQHPAKPAADVELLKKTYADFKRQLETAAAEKKKLESQLRKPPQVHGLTDRRAEADPFFLLRRGEWNNRGRRVLPNVPAVLRSSPDAFQSLQSSLNPSTTGARLALARWLTQPRNPLTARVIVNRVWQHHFGRGIVATPEDFGKTGAPPTHPELLDWLAVEFVKKGWSLKQLHRLILTSSAWRQQSRVRSAAVAVDPENRLLWRMPLRRMSAEAIRDTMLAVAGKLNAQMYGSPVAVRNLPDGQVVAADSASGNRRSIYLLHRRSTPVTILETFDAPRLTTNCLQRRTSNVVSQALLMLNSGFVDAQAESLAERIAAGSTSTVEHVRAAYLQVLGRPPNAAELEASKRFLHGQTRRYAAANGVQPPIVNSLVDLCLVLFNSAEFLYVD